MALILVTIILASSCSSGSGTETKPGLSFAALSCSSDLQPTDPAVSQIVNYGFDRRFSGSFTDGIGLPIVTDLVEPLADSRSRALLGAKAAAADTYWQPLADAWALNEALLTAISEAQTFKIKNAEGVDVPNAAIYKSFISNVNLEYAAVTKDTYCRIAFELNGLPITYSTTNP